jgi:hypothetical protein
MMMIMIIRSWRSVLPMTRMEMKKIKCAMERRDK